MRLLILSDVQGNITALEAVLREARRQGPDAIVALGDLACGFAGGEVIGRLRALEAVCVRGNMDDVLLAPENQDVEADAPEFAELDRWAAQRLSRSSKSWLAGLPLAVELELPGGRRMLGCHGTPASNDVPIGLETPGDEVIARLDGRSVDVFATGHLHDPMRRRVGNIELLNPGSTGWPGPGLAGKRPLVASYAMLQASRERIDIAIRQVPYRTADFRAAVHAAAMPHADFYLDLWAL